MALLRVIPPLPSTERGTFCSISSDKGGSSLCWLISDVLARISKFLGTYLSTSKYLTPTYLTSTCLNASKETQSAKLEVRDFCIAAAAMSSGGRWAPWWKEERRQRTCFAGKAGRREASLHTIPKKWLTHSFPPRLTSSHLHCDVSLGNTNLFAPTSSNILYKSP